MAKARTLTELRDDVLAATRAFDPALLPVGEAMLALRDVTSMRKALAAVETMLATRVASRESVAKTAGTSLTEAGRMIDTGARLARLENVAGAAKEGQLSPRQAEAIARAVEAAPEAEARLLDLAARASIRELEDECGRTRRAADPDPEATRRRQHAARSARTWIDSDQMWNLHLRHRPEVGALIQAELEAERGLVFDAARANGMHETGDNYTADAVVNLLLGETTCPRPEADPGERGGSGGSDGHEGSAFGGAVGDSAPEGEPPGTRPAARTGRGTTHGEPRAAGPPSGEPGPQERARRRNRPKRNRRRRNVKIIVRVDHSALLRGHVRDEEICDVPGVGPIPVAAVREMIATEDPFLAALVTRGVDVASVVHLGRRVTALQRTALEWLYPVCAAEGCGRAARLQIDHRTGWAVTHQTVLGDLDGLCDQDHLKKTRHGWALVPGTGARPFVPPDDPRHPGRAHDQRGAACHAPA